MLASRRRAILLGAALTASLLIAGCSGDDPAESGTSTAVAEADLQAALDKGGDLTVWAWEPTLNDEHHEARWCSPDEAEALLYWPEPRDLVRSLAER